MTMNEVIEYVDRVKKNAYADKDKYKWLSALDGMISVEVHGEETAVNYDLPADADKELLVAAPYDDIYSLYVMAQIDLHNQEYDHYNNAVLVFAERLGQYKAWYIQKYAHGKAKNFRNVMG